MLCFILLIWVELWAFFVSFLIFLKYIYQIGKNFVPVPYLHVCFICFNYKFGALESRLHKDYFQTIARYWSNLLPWWLFLLCVCHKRAILFFAEGNRVQISRQDSSHTRTLWHLILCMILLWFMFTNPFKSVLNENAYCMSDFVFAWALWFSLDKSVLAWFVFPLYRVYSL